MDEIINFVIQNNYRIIFISVSFFLTLWIWYYIWHASTNVALKLLYAFFAAIPFIGPLLVLWIIHIPDSQPIDKRATMNHYGQGGKFISTGNKQHTHSDFVNDSKNKRKINKSRKKTIKQKR